MIHTLILFKDTTKKKPVQKNCTSIWMVSWKVVCGAVGYRATEAHSDDVWEEELCGAMAQPWSITQDLSFLCFLFTDGFKMLKCVQWVCTVPHSVSSILWLQQPLAVISYYLKTDICAATVGKHCIKSTQGKGEDSREICWKHAIACLVWGKIQSI